MILTHEFGVANGVCSIGHSRLSQAAKALRLTIPVSILARFDEVIE